MTSCYALFNGNKNSREYGLKGDMSGLFQIYNKVPPAVAYDIPVSLSALNNFMGDVLKYEIKTDGVSFCGKFRYTVFSKKGALYHMVVQFFILTLFFNEVNTFSSEIS